MRSKLLLTAFVVLLVLPVCVLAQDDENWPPLSYLRSDYKEVDVVLHVRAERAEVVYRIGGYETWRINAVVIESLKGTFKKGDAIVYNHGAETGFKVEWFTGEKFVFLIAERDKDGQLHHSVLENSTLSYTKDRIQKLRAIKRSYAKRRRR
jgi:hypothetical protein